MTTFFGDTETYCETPLAHGLHRYAETVEITVFTWAIDDGPVQVIDCTVPGWEAKRDAAIGEMLMADEIVFQNLAFDATVMRHAWGVELPLERCVDTMVQALAHSLPGALDKLCAVLGVETDDAKDKAGKALIQLFCKPRPKNSKVRRATRLTHPVEWQRFLDYAASDIRAMRQARKKLPAWNYPDNATERELWMLDQKINNRGVAVDRELAEAAVRAVEREKKRLKVQITDLTEGAVTAATQRDKLLAHILEAYGVELLDLQKGALERRLSDDSIPEPVKELLRIRLMATVTSTAKYKTLLRSVSSDDRLRGTLQFCGASRTGRWAGRLFQPQNLMRPTMKQAAIEEAIELFKADAADLVYDNVMDVAGNAIRGALVASPGHKLIASDLSNIEGRFLAWLAGEEWKLEAFRAFDAGNGPDLYLVGAAAVLGKPVDQITPDERQAQGKVPELACGYQGAVGAFQAMAKIYGLDMGDKRALEIVKAWRKKNSRIVELWYELERQAIRAVEQPGLRLEAADGKLVFQRDGAWLRMRLPSGRCLCYPGVALEDGKLTYMGTNQYTRKWERLHTYGGKLVENATQAGARDVLSANMPEAEAQGYRLVLTCHDENITETLDTPDYTSDTLSRIMSTVPVWAKGLPLAASGWEGKKYRK